MEFIPRLRAVRERRFDLVLAEAVRLKEAALADGGHPAYWSSFHRPTDLAGWLLANVHCAYCGQDLAQEAITERIAASDHILPKKRYPHLEFDDMFNIAACCPGCNILKGSFDPNGYKSIYSGEDPLKYTQRLIFIRRARHESRLRRKQRRNQERMLHHLNTARTRLS